MPSGRALARALASFVREVDGIAFPSEECGGDGAPSHAVTPTTDAHAREAVIARRILEVGPGTGAVTGEIQHVDSGYHVVGMKNPSAPDLRISED